MKNESIGFIVTVSLLSTAAIALAGSRSGGNYAANDTTDGGGQRVSSADYVIDGSIGGIGGVSTVVAPPETVKHGYIGQLTEMTGLNVSAAPASINEGATSQLGGVASLDDGTVSLLGGNELTWSTVAYPLASLNGAGLLTAALVYSDVSGTVTGSMGGTRAATVVMVLDSSPDNYGSYSGDGLPDSWQVRYFGINSPNAGPGVDLFGTGNNYFKYVAGLNPTNPASVFVLKVGTVSAQSNQKSVIFSPCWPDRTYQVECRTNLLSGNFGSLGAYSTSDNGSERTVTDLAASELRKFYRVQISYEP